MTVCLVQGFNAFLIEEGEEAFDVLGAEQVGGVIPHRVRRGVLLRFEVVYILIKDFFLPHGLTLQGLEGDVNTSLPCPLSASREGVGICFVSKMKNFQQTIPDD